MKAAWKSDKGKVRENNEDSVLADAEKGIFLLADGMGGHRGGDVASALAVRTAYDLLRERGGRTGNGEMPRLLADALAAAHSAVSKKGMTPGLEGMGTTLDILVVKGSRAHICHLGDSRVYLLRPDGLRRITTDDNYAAYLMEYGHVAEEDLPPGSRNMLTQAVGVSESLVPEIHALALEEGDLFILCSDGLTGMLADREMESVLGKGDDLERAVAALVEEANGRGGYDNITVLLVRPEPPFSPPRETLLLPA